MSKIDFKAVIEKFDELVGRGFCSGAGTSIDGQVCVEQAVAIAMGLEFNDNPSCVEPVIAGFKRNLNDCQWSSPEARAAGLRDLGIAQIGSAGVVDPIEFTNRLSEKYIRILIPTVFRKVFPKDDACLQAALKCEELGTASAASAAYSAAYSAEYSAAYRAAASAAYRAAASAASAAYSAEYSAASAAYSAASAASAAYSAASAASAAYSAAYSAEYSAEYSAASAADEILTLAASLALEVLRELKSPGCEWIKVAEVQS